MVAVYTVVESAQFSPAEMLSAACELCIGNCCTVCIVQDCGVNMHDAKDDAITRRYTAVLLPMHCYYEKKIE